MGFFSKIKKGFFKIKDEGEDALGLKKSPEDLREEIEKEKNTCCYCKNLIQSYEQKRTFDKKKYHVKCFRRLRKEAERGFLKGDIDLLKYA